MRQYESLYKSIFALFPAWHNYWFFLSDEKIYEAKYRKNTYVEIRYARAKKNLNRILHYAKSLWKFIGQPAKAGGFSGSFYFQRGLI